MSPTKDSNCPDGMESQMKFWAIVLFALSCPGLSLAHYFNRKSVYRNSTSAIVVEDTCLRWDLMYHGRLMALMASLIT